MPFCVVYDVLAPHHGCVVHMNADQNWLRWPDKADCNLLWCHAFSVFLRPSCQFHRPLYEVMQKVQKAQRTNWEGTFKSFYFKHGVGIWEMKGISQMITCLVWKLLWLMSSLEPQFCCDMTIAKRMGQLFPTWIQIGKGICSIWYLSDESALPTCRWHHEY